MIPGIYIVKTRSLNNCYSIKCNKQQEMYCVSTAKICTLGGVDKIWIRPDQITDQITERKEKPNHL